MENKNPNDIQDPDSMTSSVAQRWPAVLGMRNQLALELDTMASELPSEGSQQLQSISRWLKGPAKLEEALQRPDVMAVCLPLIKSTADEKQVSPSEIAQAARLGFCSVGRSVSGSRHLLSRLAYPIIILLAASLLAILFSCWVAPQFEEMFAEFGIELPSMTMAVLGFSKLVRRWWSTVASVLVGVILMSWIWSRLASSHGPSWLDQQLMSTRNALANWAWHVSLLLDAGLSQGEAIRYAGEATKKALLRRASFVWASRIQQNDVANDQLLLFEPKFDLLRNAIQLPPSSGKIKLLREVADYYWDRNHTIGDWWIQCLGSLILWIVGAAVLLSVISLFMPLIAIVSGLTSNKM